MTIASVAVDDPVQAATMNQLITNVNTSPYRAIFTSNSTWQVPAGCHKFKVTLTGGGGDGGDVWASGGGEDTIMNPGGVGGNGAMISAVFSGIDVGTTYVITIGAGGSPGGTTSFGVVMSSTGGQKGGAGPPGAPGVGTFPAGAPAIYHNNGIFAASGSPQHAFGKGGEGAGPYWAITAGYQGVVIIEY